MYYMEEELNYEEKRYGKVYDRLIAIAEDIDKLIEEEKENSFLDISIKEDLEEAMKKLDIALDKAFYDIPSEIKKYREEGR